MILLYRDRKISLNIRVMYFTEAKFCSLLDLSLNWSVQWVRIVPKHHDILFIVHSWRILEKHYTMIVIKNPV